MTPEPTPLVTVLPCEAEKARDILQRERGSALWLNDDEVIRAMVRFAHDARLAALEAAAKVADEAATHWNGLAWDRRNGGLDDTHCCAKASASTELATAIRSLSNKGGRDGE